MSYRPTVLLSYFSVVTASIPLWQPTARDLERANLTRFIAQLAVPDVTDSPSLYQFSIAHPEKFWAHVWRFCGVIADEHSTGEPWDAVLEGGERMAPPDPQLRPRWFTGAPLNFAENLLRYRDDREAIVSWTGQGPGRRPTFRQLTKPVAQFASSPRPEA